MKTWFLETSERAERFSLDAISQEKTASFCEVLGMKNSPNHRVFLATLQNIPASWIIRLINSVLINALKYFSVV